MARGGVQEVAQAVEAEHVGDLVRIADRGGGAARQHRALELERRHQAALDVHVGVDEARHGDPAAPVDLAHAAVVVVGADDPVAADRDVALVQLAGRDVQEARALDHQVGGAAPARLVDPAAELCPGRGPSAISVRCARATVARAAAPRPRSGSGLPRAPAGP